MSVSSWTELVPVLILLTNCVYLTDGTVKEPFGQQPRISVENGHLILRAALNRNVSILSSGDGSIWVNNMDFSNALQKVNQFLSGSVSPSYSMETLSRNIDELRNRFDVISDTTSQLNRLEGNVTSLATRLDQLVGKGSKRISNRLVRQVLRKVTTLEAKVAKFTQLLTTDECSSNPCRNGGTCTDSYNGYICQCLSSWEGPTCETDVNECSRFAGSALGCQNGATCYNSPGSYRCECAPNWYGIHCTENHDDCSLASHQELCAHGTCVNEKRVVPGQAKYRCLCDEGWTRGSNGPACDQDIDECSGSNNFCSKNPPVACINFPGTFHCGPCPTGYAGDGKICIDVNECEINNGGCSSNPLVRCINTIGSRECGSCPNGYMGNGITCMFVGVCSVNRGGCHPLATCVENTAITTTYRECRCPAGYVGNGEGLTGCVQTQGMSCTNNPCQHGTCQTTGTTIHCICYPGYTGTLCNQQVDLCSSQPCLNGGTCTSQGNAFSCSCTYQYEGVLCADERQNCGGHLSNDNGMLQFPMNSEEYGHRESCAWVITVNSSLVINVTFTRFHLEPAPDCEYDHLQINDGPSVNYPMLGRFCGTDTLVGRSFNSTHNQLYLWFKSDRSIAGMGFSLYWNVTEPLCGAQLDPASYGAINSPGYPGNYPRNRDCYWLVQVNRGKRIQFHFATLQLEHHENCSFDYLKIFDGASESDPELAKYCTTITPPPILSSGSFALLHLHSDAYVEDTGFHITYAAVPGVEGCGGTLTKPSGTISSPNYPNTYDNLLTCEWLVRIHPGDRIQLKFNAFHVENHPNCGYDYLAIYDGTSDGAPILGRYCGANIPPDMISNSHQIFVKFHTDSSVRNNGFQIEYRTICGGAFTEMQGTFTSPYYPDNYPSSVTCYYELNLPPGYLIQLDFPVFSLEECSSCSCDFVQVRDGNSPQSNITAQYCGSNLPETIISTYNHLWIMFQSDGSVRNAGFLANYTGIEVGCGGVKTENRGYIQTPSHPNYYPPSIKCNWLIRAPPGHVVRLTFETFALEAGHNCSYDYVLIHDGNGAKMGRFCGHSTPPILTSSDEVMLVTFVADANVFHEGFNASYIFFDSSQTCSGNYYLDFGVIRSPRYPQNYPHHMHCSYVLHAENGRQIRLNITDFDVEFHKDCRYDYLEIRNGGYETSPLIGRYCGNKIPRQIISHSNVMYLEFHSDGSSSAAGFRIFFDSATTGCGGTLKTSQGSIVSPNYPQPYNHEAECTWIIRIAQGSKISIAIIDVDIEEHSTCVYDYLQIHDGTDENSRSMARLCNNQYNPGHMMSSGNVVFIKFRTDLSGNGRGFHLTYRAVCSNELKGYQGVIESLNFPNAYPHNENCTWTITAPMGNNISLIFSHILLEDSTACGMDHVEVFEQQKNGTNSSLGKFCGTPTPLPAPIITTTNVAVVRFSADSSVSEIGFRLEYAVQGCGGELRRSYGVITSPNYPSSYNNQLECMWHIQVPLGSRIRLTIIDLDIEWHKSCAYDYLKVFGGEDENAPRLLNLCSRITGTQSTISHGNHMYIHFFSDSHVVGKGFKAYYSAIENGCGGIYTAEESMLMSPFYPSPYNANDDCYYLIQIKRTYRVTLEFYEFSLPSSINCTSGYVAVFDGNSTNSPLLQRLCGEMPANPVMSATGSQMLVQLKADGVNVGKGFKANYKSDCGSRLIADDGGEIMSPNYPHLARKNCSWIISASDPGEKVTLIITHIFMSVDDCDSISPHAQHLIGLVVRDGDSADSPIIGRYCGRRTPPAITSQGNSLHVTLIYIGVFRASYGITSSYCGGTLNSVAGSFGSPDYPNNYPLDTECVWSIESSVGNKVQLSFQSFDIEASDYCNVDYVEVHENDAAGPLLGRYCGNRSPANITAAHKIWMKFRSDNLGTASGFLAHYGLLHGSWLNGTEGIIESPGYPHTLYHNYHGDDTFEWTITVDSHLFVSIQFLVLEIGVNGFGDCDSSIQVYDGLSDTAPILGEYCNFVLPEPVVSHTSEVFIRFNIHHYNPGRWRLRWVAVNQTTAIASSTDEQAESSCWHVIDLNSTMAHVFTSPGFPNNYEPNLNCTWIIRSAIFEHVQITFHYVSLEGAMNHCDYANDKITVYVAPISFTDSWDLNKTICGHAMDDYVLESQNNVVKVVFQSDNYYNLYGFNATAKTVCGSHISATNGHISNTDLIPYMLHIPSSRGLVCKWVINVRTRRTIQLTFDEFNVPADRTCQSMQISLLNGGHDTSPFLGQGRYCGTSPPTVPETSSNQATVELRIVSFAQGSPQFKLRFDEVSQTCGGSHFFGNSVLYFVINSPNYPNPPNHPLECTHVIMSNAGTRMRVDFDHQFHMSENCWYGEDLEYVELLDGGTVNAPPIRRYCGTDHPSSVMTTGNALVLKYVTNHEHPGGGYQAKISQAVCGGIIFTNSYNSIKSPNYPSNYSSSVDCEWIAKVPEGHSMILYVQKLDTPPASNCTLTDYVEIRERDKDGDIKYILCGSANDVGFSKYLRIADNQAYIKFKTDGSRTGQGFSFYFYPDRTYCGNTLSTPSGTIESPNFPAALTTSQNCRWTINAPEGRRVTLSFSDFNLPKDEATGLCISRLNVVNVSRYYSDVANSPPICGNELPSPIDSSGSNLYLLLSTFGLAAGEGFSAQYTTDKEAICGGVLYPPSGTLESPNVTFSNNSWVDCKWRLEMESPNKTVSFKFDFLELPGNMANFCRSSSLTFYKHQGGFLDSPLCGNLSHRRYVITSPYRMLMIKFMSTLSTPFRGFSARYNTSDCGGILSGTDFEITSPGYPNNYPPNMDCHWTINVPYNERVMLTTLDLRLEENCNNDYVMVKNGDSYYSPILGKFCGNSQPSPILSNYNHITIIFHSDEYGSAPGFKMTTSEVDQGCGGLTHYQTGTIKSPNYPLKYDNNVECEWIIEYPIGSLVNISFVDRFDIEREATCSKDYVLIENFDNNEWSVLGKKCGSETPGTFISTSTKMRITFHSDSDIMGDGFKIKYTSGCGGHFNKREGSIFSPNFPNNYPENLNCIYLIGDPEHYTRLTFDSDQFGVEAATNCVYDHVIVYEGNTTSAATRGKYCGDIAPPALILYGQILVEFKSDYIFSGHGFIARYEITECGGVRTAPYGVINTPKDPHVYLNFMRCTWVIEAPEDKVIALRFNYFELEASNNCYYDAVVIYEGNSTYGSQIGTLCGADVPPVIKSSSNQMTVVLRTDSSVTLRGFEAHYYTTYGCGGTTRSDSGEFVSLDVDKDGKYEPNLDCNWKLIGADEKVLNITFSEFELEPPTNGTCINDFVEIRDGLGSGDPVIARLCGNVSRSFIVSTNMASVVFHSDDLENRRGFKARFVSIPSLCGPTTLQITNVSQTLSSPNYPSPYPPNVWCRWHFIAPSMWFQVQISFQELDVPCDGDYLEAHSAYMMGKLYRMCGPTHPHDVTARSGLWMSLHSNENGAGKGFSLTYILSECNQIYVRDNGVIATPNYDFYVYQEHRCSILIRAMPGRTIALYFSRFGIHYSDVSRCDESFEVHDGSDSSANLLSKSCGTTLPSPVFSTGHELFINTTLKYITYSLSYTTTDKGRGCGGSLNHINGTFTSPLYPEAYNKSDDCQWMLSVPGQHTMTLHFTQYLLNSVAGCQANYLEIYEGHTVDSGKRATKLCGDDNPAPYHSLGNKVLVRLVTDSNNTAPGFVAHFAMNTKYEPQHSSFVVESGDSDEEPYVLDGTLRLY